VRIRLLSVGRDRADPLAPAVAEYVSRIDKFLPAEAEVLRSGRDDRLAERILKEGRGGGKVLVALDERGREIDSDGLADLVAEWMNRSVEAVTFVVGGADGLPSEVLQRADLSLSLSRMTLPHRVARLVVAEQIYRALCAVRNVPYRR